VRKRSLIERAKRLTYDANARNLPASKDQAAITKGQLLKGIDSSTPVPGEE